MSLLTVALGYDARLVLAMNKRAQSDLELLAAAWGWAMLGLASAVGYTFWLLGHSGLLSLAASAAALTLQLLLLRLTLAGGGIPQGVSAAEARAHNASWTALLWLALLAVMFAQPAQLPLVQREQAQLVASERASLLALHIQALATSGVDATRSLGSDGYADAMADNEFVVLRLRALWRAPALASRNTLGFLLLLLGPVCFVRSQTRAALLSYERLRYGQVSALIRDDARRSEQTRAALLARYPTYRPCSERGPLSLPWPVPPARSDRADA